MLFNLIDEYIKQFPQEESPENYFSIFGAKYIENFLKNRKGRKILYIPPKEESTLDGGTLQYA